MDKITEKLIQIEAKIDLLHDIVFGKKPESLIDRTKRYFELFSTKNVKGLENEMYAEDIHLRDWNGEWKGKQAVLEMNENLFNNEFTIDIDDVKKADRTTIVQFTLHIAGTQYKVIDIIDWDDDDKIKRILAYNG